MTAIPRLMVLAIALVLLHAAPALAAPVNTTPPSISGTTQDGETLTANDGVWTGAGMVSTRRQWQRCFVICDNIPGAEGETYVLTALDVGATIRIVVTATDQGDNETAVLASDEVGPVLADPPVNVSPPQVNAAPTPLAGDDLTVTPGVWNGTDPQLTYQWQRCTAPNVCSNIGGATGTSYTLTTADFNRTIRVVETASNDAGSASEESAETATVQSKPFNTTPPAVSGTTVDGETLTVTDGVWDGNAPIQITRQWQRCNPTCSNISNATGSSYVLDHADVDATIRVRVTATNGHGSTDVFTTNTATIGEAPPSNVNPPEIDDTTPVVGQQLTAISDDADWDGTPPFDKEYQWQRCDPTCDDIPAATNQTYTPVEDDFGHTLRVEVTASNDAGSDAAASAETSAVDSAPFSVTAPTVAGTARDGMTLTGTDGAFDGSDPITTTRNWQRCTSPTDCTDIQGATGPSYVLTHADVGLRIRLRVHASNAFGEVDAHSTPTAVVAKAPPTAIPGQEPTITVPGGGAPRTGQELSAETDQSDWNGTPLFTFEYRWRRCHPTEGCEDITGPAGAGQQYTVQTADFGHTLQVRVTASNGEPPPAAALSAETLTVESVPFTTTDPTISGTARDGQVLTSTDGVWDGNAPIGLTRNWQRCTSPTDCVDIQGATGTSYTLTAADIGMTIRLRVRGTNGLGSTDAFSSPSATVEVAPPSNVTPPTITPGTGPYVSGQTLSAVTAQADWSGTGPFDFTYQWQRCTGPSTCSNISGATGASYQLTNDDFERTIRVVVRATNSAGFDEVETAQTTAVEARPFATAAPTISSPSSPTDGDLLTVTSDGTWDGTEPIDTPTPQYQWERCQGAACVDIPGETSEDYRLSAADVGRTVRVRVTRTNVHGAGTASSNEVGPVAADAPENLTVPTISGTPMDGELLVASPGGWDGSLPSYSYQWQRCTSPLSCSNIPGATGSTYRLTAADYGHTIRVQVTGTNSAGSDTALSDPTLPVAARPPSNRVAPSITGPARVGRTLTANDGLWDGTAVSLSRNWLRCGGSGCSDTGATGPTYSVTGADAGSVIVLQVNATGLGGNASAQSAPTATVSGNSPPSASFVYHPRRPSTSDTIALTSTSSDPDGAVVSQSWDTDNDGRFDDGNGVEAEVRFRRAGRHDVSLRVVDNEGAANTVTRTINVRRADRLISPFPVVRIVGGGTPRGARIRTLVVRAPRGAKVTVRCKGRRCPARRQAKAVRSGRARFKRFERSLVAGTVLEVFVTQRDRIGKYTRFQIRRGKAPRRTDRCLLPGSRRPRACPGG